MDLPDNVSAAGASLIANASGTVQGSYTVLITPEEIDEGVGLAVEKGGAYRPPEQ